MNRRASRSIRFCRKSRPSTFFSPVQAFQHGFHQLLLVPGQQRVNLVVRFVADRVNLRAELLAREVWILVKQRLNFIVVLV
jgi:hypothetical protein